MNDGHCPASSPPADLGAWHGRAGWALVVALLLAGISVACSSEEWTRQNETCVRQSEEGPVRRVINYADPELCGRSVKNRMPDRVRVPLPPQVLG